MLLADGRFADFSTNKEANRGQTLRGQFAKEVERGLRESKLESSGIIFDSLNSININTEKIEDKVVQVEISGSLDEIERQEQNTSPTLLNQDSYDLEVAYVYRKTNLRNNYN